VEGEQWPLKSGKPEELWWIQEPRRLILHLPSGKTWETPSRLLFLEQEEGTVTRAEVSPLPEAVAFPKAVRELEREIDDLGLPRTPLIESRIAEWKQGTPRFSVSLAGDLEPHVHLFAKIDHNSEGKWYIVVEFETKRPPE
jgi:hypothetical protein